MLRPAGAHEIELARQAYDRGDRGEAGRERERGDGAMTAHASAEDQSNHRRGDRLPEPPAICYRDLARPIPTMISPSLCRAAPRRATSN
jgi:hypothetical protein